MTPWLPAPPTHWSRIVQFLSKVNVMHHGLWPVLNSYPTHLKSDDILHLDCIAHSYGKSAAHTYSKFVLTSQFYSYSNLTQNVLSVALILAVVIPYSILVQNLCKMASWPLSPFMWQLLTQFSFKIDAKWCRGCLALSQRHFPLHYYSKLMQNCFWAAVSLPLVMFL